jgi:hypothetical protein
MTRWPSQRHQDPWKPREHLLPAMGPVTTAVLLSGLPSTPAPSPDKGAWNADLAEIARSRLSAAALRAAERRGIELEASTADILRNVAAAETLRTLTVDIRGAQVVSDLGRAGFDPVVTKGPGIAAIIPEGDTRVYVDLDVVVPPSDFKAALAFLRQQEFVPTLPQQGWAYFERYCGEAINLVRDDGAAIDLHHTIPPWHWGARLSVAELQGRAIPLTVAGHEIKVVDPVHNLMVAALHVVSDKGYPGRSLWAWRDVLLLASVCDPDVVAETARRARLDWWLMFLLNDLPEHARPQRLVGALDHPRPTIDDRIRLRLLLPPALGSRHTIGTLYRLPLPNAIAFAAGRVVPNRGSMVQRLGPDASYLRWWRSSIERLRTGQR